MTSIRPAERQHKGRDQSSTKNVTSKTPRLHKVAKQHKASDRSVGNPKTSCIQTKSKKIWFRKTKSEKWRKEANWAKEDPKSWCHGKVQKKAPLMMHARVMTKNPIKMPYNSIPGAIQPHQLPPGSMCLLGLEASPCYPCLKTWFWQSYSLWAGPTTCG